MAVARGSEEARLLLEHEDQSNRSPSSPARSKLTHRLLPVALLAALGSAGAAAPTVFAYAYLCCDNPLRCNEDEHQVYARTTALATTIANICGILALGPAAHFSRNRRSLGLSLWFLSRGLSERLTVAHKNIPLAIVGRAFEGAATDNILHFHLNAIYVEVAPESDSPRLLGLSLAFYMVGLAASPPVTGMFKEFTWSFYFAIAVFSLSIIYLQSCVPWTYHYRQQNDVKPAGRQNSTLSAWEATKGILKDTFSLSNPVISPLSLFCTQPFAALYGLALFNFTAGNAYFFPALMIHTSTRFAFTSQQNGFIFSLTSGATGIYMFLLLLVIPRTRIPSTLASFSRRIGRPFTWDFVFALVSMMTLAVALYLLSAANESWQIYVVAVVSALGNAAPAFVKSHLNAMVEESLKAQAVSALALCESLGSVASAIIVGAAQSLGGGGGGLPFFVASSLVISAAVFFFLAGCHGGPPSHG
ncbi:major facilitator superfamily domain-containing protein [Sphaerosporella brunnea]|uniref:Major facilitator superfamily domain-containing protein n=1 Tax=Sphaerosporella brunnea TaxID=1250544 RepID=A0A5J5EJ70_9PEZI|nr:major facilitator superfamily domain-containing protein [Sphaerosporella brunnea]